MGENASGGDPSEQDLAQWASQHSLTHPVVADPGWAITMRYVSGATMALPTEHLLGRGAVILGKNSWFDEADIEEALSQ